MLLWQVPLAHIDHFFEPPARLMVRLDNAIGSGIRITGQGLECDGRIVSTIGPAGFGTSIRATGALKFPTHLPIEDGQDLFG